jgi:hypothetical protein
MVTIEKGECAKNRSAPVTFLSYVLTFLSSDIFFFLSEIHELAPGPEREKRPRRRPDGRRFCAIS